MCAPLIIISLLVLLILKFFFLRFIPFIVLFIGGIAALLGIVGMPFLIFAYRWPLLIAALAFVIATYILDRQRKARAAAQAGAPAAYRPEK
ncbi:MAG: hypothetical protein A2Z86_11905 [Candidatus Glassbacteria bacterium GWA2_58_10]|uniref:Uncharacterized protein n=1 Tax=Candidatus Glassbacteria bacterium GWA2_58_10 TaxID=1817865 RepID=A0A1F5YGN3_9BACT|nr:MAG: hypothetical protein A2Z86_11905 [Candidatus Glassbacteria bacterium GWA2_58_10]